MIDISQTIAPKSDQLNADDLIGRPMTIRVSRVSKMDGDQPVSIHFEGDGGRPYKGTQDLQASRDSLNNQQDGALAGILTELERIASDADAADDDFPGFDPGDSEAA